MYACCALLIANCSVFYLCLLVQHSLLHNYRDGVAKRRMLLPGFLFDMNLFFQTLLSSHLLVCLAACFAGSRFRPPSPMDDVVERLRLLPNRTWQRRVWQEQVLPLHCCPCLRCWCWSGA